MIVKLNLKKIKKRLAFKTRFCPENKSRNMIPECKLSISLDMHSIQMLMLISQKAAVGIYVVVSLMMIRSVKLISDTGGVCWTTSHTNMSLRTCSGKILELFEFSSLKKRDKQTVIPPLTGVSVCRHHLVTLYSSALRKRTREDVKS